MTRPSKMNTAVDNLIDLTRKVENSKLTILELSSASALYRFAEGSLCLRIFKADLDLAEMKDPLDIFNVLNTYTFTISTCHSTPTPPISASRQPQAPISQKHIHSVDEQSNLPQASRVRYHLARLPRDSLCSKWCRSSGMYSFTYNDHSLQPLGAFKLPSIDELVVCNEAWSHTWGSQRTTSTSLPY